MYSTAAAGMVHSIQSTVLKRDRGDMDNPAYQHWRCKHEHISLEIAPLGEKPHMMLITDLHRNIVGGGDTDQILLDSAVVHLIISPWSTMPEALHFRRTT
jgi:hypothetical protein